MPTLQYTKHTDIIIINYFLILCCNDTHLNIDNFISKLRCFPHLRFCYLTIFYDSSVSSLDFRKCDEAYLGMLPGEAGKVRLLFGERRPG